MGALVPVPRLWGNIHCEWVIIALAGTIAGIQNGSGRGEILKKENKMDKVIEILEYLDDLRKSGITNMFGAGVFIEQKFGVDKKDASEILAYWMSTFNKR